MTCPVTLVDEGRSTKAAEPIYPFRHDTTGSLLVREKSKHNLTEIKRRE